MNYIAEIIAFYRWLGSNPLKGTSIALWHALMSIANDVSHGAEWQLRITPSVAMLQSRSGLSKDAILTARNQLKQAGRIDWKERGGSASTAYTIIPFVSKFAAEFATEKQTQTFVSEITTQTSPQTTTQITTQTSPQTTTQTSPIYKQDKTEQNMFYTCCEFEEQNLVSDSPVIELILNDKTYYPVYQRDIDRWAELYPAVDVLAQLRSMAGWCEANPRRRKTKTGIQRFINNWLSGEQNKGSSIGKPQGKVWKELD